MLELIRTNDLVFISLVEAILTAERVGYLVADRHMSSLEGAIGMLPRRIMVEAAQIDRARRLMREAGLDAELRPAGPHES